jgi:hypothetical protein
VLAYGFTENCQFVAKSYRNSIFLCHHPHITNLLYITVPYLSFYRFWKNKFSLKIHSCAAYSFTENRQFGEKIDRNSVFLGHNVHNADRLYITVPYMSFYWFLKIQNFAQNPYVLAYGFSGNRRKLHISGSWPPYSR